MHLRALVCFVVMPWAIACSDDDGSRDGQHRPAVGVTISGGRSSGGASGAGGGGASSLGGASGNGGAPVQNELSRCALELPFVYQTGRGYWLGGDHAASVQLASDRALVTFRDSFVGGPNKETRADSVVVGSSAAFISCRSGKYEIEYAWGGAGHEHAALFDDDPTDDVRLWVEQPWISEGELFATATRVGASDNVEHGTTLIRVKNPQGPWLEWNIEYFELTQKRASVGRGVVDDGRYVYLFTPQAEMMVLSRIGKDRLLESTISESSLDTLRDDGTWRSGLDLEHARRLPLPASTGLTLRKHAPSGRFLALFTNTSVLPAASVSVSSSLALEGPWSTPSLVYTVPEMNPASPEYRSDLTCQGAAEHPAFNPLADRELLFTYTCTHPNRAKLVENMSALVPRTVRLAIPLAF